MLKLYSTMRRMKRETSRRQRSNLRASFNHLKKTCPGEDIAGFAIDTEVQDRLDAIQQQREKEEDEASSKIDPSQFAPASPDDGVGRILPPTSIEENRAMWSHHCLLLKTLFLMNTWKSELRTWNNWCGN
jgi:hypothetical protein